MASHHFIGTGGLSALLAAAAGEPQGLLRRISRIVTECGLTVVAEQAVPFTGGGLTLVWVLAESHLVLHCWQAEGFATVDLHVCDFQGPSVARARALRDALERFCFASGSAAWQELELADPAPAAAR